MFLLTRSACYLHITDYRLEIIFKSKGHPCVPAKSFSRKVEQSGARKSKTVKNPNQRKCFLFFSHLKKWQVFVPFPVATKWARIFSFLASGWLISSSAVRWTLPSSAWTYLPGTLTFALYSDSDLLKAVSLYLPVVRPWSSWWGRPEGRRPAPAGPRCC